VVGAADEQASDRWSLSTAKDLALTCPLPLAPSDAYRVAGDLPRLVPLAPGRSLGCADGHRRPLIPESAADGQSAPGEQPRDPRCEKRVRIVPGGRDGEVAALGGDGGPADAGAGRQSD